MTKLDKLRKLIEEDLSSPLGRAETLILAIEKQVDYLIEQMFTNSICPPYYEAGRDCDGVGNYDDQRNECANCWREHLDMNS